MELNGWDGGLDILFGDILTNAFFMLKIRFNNPLTNQNLHDISAYEAWS